MNRPFTKVSAFWWIIFAAFTIASLWPIRAERFDPYNFDTFLQVHCSALVHPVHLRAGVNPPATSEYDTSVFRLETHAPYYEYSLVRSTPPDFIPYISQGADPVARSGEWALFKKR